MKIIRVIIAARPGTWQRLLQNDIESQPSAQVVAVANGSLTAVQLVKEHQPDLLLIDSSISSEEVIAIVNNINLESPSVQIAVISDTHQQHRKFVQAGVNFVVSTYEFKTQIQEVVNHLRELCPSANDCNEEALDANN